MEPRLPLLVTALFAAVLPACQAYDFEPVAPLALVKTTDVIEIEGQPQQANFMMLVDKSGSMDSKVSSGGTRISNLKSAMDAVLNNDSLTTRARFGMAAFPSNSTSCGGSEGATITRDVSAVRSDAPADLRQAALAVNAAIQALQTSGGTPTAASLRTLGQLASLSTDARNDYVLLLTDGLPNCNDTLPTGCECILGANCSTSSNCLDESAVVSAAAQLLSRGIQTFVVGFGDDVLGGGQAARVLNAIARAGGQARSCAAPQSCEAGESCDPKTKLCARSFYTASNASDLEAALKMIVEHLPPPCTYPLSARPSEPELLSVSLNGERVPSGTTTWSYADGSVVLAPAFCDRMGSSGNAKLEFGIIQGL